MGKVGCATFMLGLLATVLAMVSRLTHWTPMALGPKSFAATAALFLLMSIATHLCQQVCGNAQAK